MSSWNYRLCAEEYKDKVLFSVREVYYDDENTPNGYSSLPGDMYYLSELAGIETTPQEDFLEYIELIKQAADKPILWIGDRWGEEYKPE